MSSSLHKMLRYFGYFLASMVSILIISLGASSHPAVATTPVVQLLEQSPTPTGIAAPQAVSTWRDPSHQELNFYQ